MQSAERRLARLGLLVCCCVAALTMTLQSCEAIRLSSIPILVKQKAPMPELTLEIRQQTTPGEMPTAREGMGPEGEKQLQVTYPMPETPEELVKALVMTHQGMAALVMSLPDRKIGRILPSRYLHAASLSMMRQAVEANTNVAEFTETLSEEYQPAIEFLKGAWRTLVTYFVENANDQLNHICNGDAKYKTLLFNRVKTFFTHGMDTDDTSSFSDERAKTYKKQTKEQAKLQNEDKKKTEQTQHIPQAENKALRQDAMDAEAGAPIDTVDHALQGDADTLAQALKQGVDKGDFEVEYDNEKVKKIVGNKALMKKISTKIFRTRKDQIKEAEGTKGLFEEVKTRLEKELEEVTNVIAEISQAEEEALRQDAADLNEDAREEISRRLPQKIYVKLFGREKMSLDGETQDLTELQIEVDVLKKLIKETDVFIEGFNELHADLQKYEEPLEATKPNDTVDGSPSESTPDFLLEAYKARVLEERKDSTDQVDGEDHNLFQFDSLTDELANAVSFQTECKRSEEKTDVAAEDFDVVETEYNLKDKIKTHLMTELVMSDMFSSMADGEQDNDSESFKADTLDSDIPQAEEEALRQAAEEDARGKPQDVSKYSEKQLEEGIDVVDSAGGAAN